MDAAAWNERYAGADLVWTAEPNRFVAEEFAELPPGRALDLAAGEGRNAVWLAARGWAVTAVDFAAVAIDKGRRLAAAAGVGVDWIVADVRSYHPPPQRFDAVLLAYLHLPPADFAAVARAAADAVAPGGIVLVVGHDRDNIAHGVGGPQEPGILHTVDAVVSALPGLTVERAEQARRPVGTDAGARDAIDTVVRARRPPTPA